ncbi:uncharacterized protein EAE97_005205 [Botrytis byssoidea]|uniref:Uncharacterized protein n=1 Tax=Botrytis byssoidea TaxID=139641 RepID=A0A9P5IK09_9HELO|nr:uncharacterized protein EAE97_005205 [Botrytis byssoidea]KAF7944572.1 hypothetical protein EAE97_005205 [Botrytis byssoidea]
MDSKRKETDKAEDLTTTERRCTFGLRDFKGRIVPSTLTDKQIDTARPTDISNKTARISTNDWALAAFVERLRRCPGSVAEPNYDERIIRRDLKRQIAEKGSGIQEVQSLSRRSHSAMVKSMVIDTEIMDFILETEEGKKEVERLRAFFAQRLKFAER